MKTRLPRLRTLLLLLNLAVLVLPLAALTVLRTYDRQLIRQTESELFVQGAFVVESYRQALATALGKGLLSVSLVETGDATAYEKAAAQLPAEAIREDAATQEVWPGADDAMPPKDLPDADALLDAAAAATLAPVISRAAQQTLAGIRIVDPRGVVIATSRSELGLSLASRAEVQDALAGQVAVALRSRREKVRDAPLTSASRNTGVRVFVAMPVNVDGKLRGAVILSRTPMTLGKAFYQDRYYLLITALVQLAAVLALSLIAAGVVIRPVRALAERARAIADGRGEIAGGSGEIAGGRGDERALPPPRTYEVAQLSEAVTRMGSALQQRADAIRAFAASVSHELKTPLTTLGATVELLQDQLATMEPQQRARFLDILAAEVSRLNLLVDRLLELARADVVRPGGASSDLRALFEALAAREKSAALDISIALTGEPLAVKMAPELLDAVLSNLVANARRHGGAKKISLSAELCDASVRILVHNDGAEISPGNRARIFDPFFTTARAQGGTGMGLTIAQKLVQAHQGTLVLLERDATDAPGVTFAIELPAAST